MTEDGWEPLMVIGHNIKATQECGAITGAIILTYCAIDAMAHLSMPDNQEKIGRKDFINWVEKYMKADPKQPYQYRGIDLYGARCGIIHTFGATSDLSDEGKCKVFNYHKGSDHIYKPDVDKNLVSISWDRFINDFIWAGVNFGADIKKDKELYKRAEKRIKDLFFLTPI